MQEFRNIGAYVDSIEPATIFFAKEVYEQHFPRGNFVSFCKALSRLEEKGLISRVAKGVYSKPKEGPFNLGPVPVSETDILSPFLGEHGVLGITVGYTLFRKYGLTTQVEKNLTVYSTQTACEVRKIKNITIKRLTGELTPENKPCLEFLFILDSFTKIQDIDFAALNTYLRKTAPKLPPSGLDQALKMHRFSKRTIAQAKEVFDFYGVKHNLNKYLSPASTYKTMSMEDIYELARR